MESIIKWHTGEPREKGMYLVTTKDGLIRITQFMIEYGIKAWAFGIKVVAWCNLRDIKPYKGEE